MRLTAKIVPFSGVVGGGIVLQDEQGRSRYLLGLLGTSLRVSTDETKRDYILVAQQLKTMIDAAGGLELPDSEPVTTARDGIEAQAALNDVYPGDPLPPPADDDLPI